MLRPQSVTKRVNASVESLFSGVRIDVEVDMKKWLAALGFLAIFALDWAALHDIIKGEQDVWLEWTVVLFSLLLLLFVIRKWLNRRA